MTPTTPATRTSSAVTVQDALFGDPVTIDADETGPVATQDPREVARIVHTAHEPGYLLIERTSRVLRADPTRPGCADAVSRHDADTVAQLLGSGHLKLGGTHHIHHAGQEGPARSVLVPKQTWDMVTRWDHLRPVPDRAPVPTTGRRPRSSGVIAVDVVEPGKALVTLATGHGGTVLRDGSRYRVEDEHGTHLGHASSYRAGARLLARHHGYQPGPVEIDHEHRHHH